MRVPPAAGPVTAANWKVLADHVIASGNSFRSTNCGKNDALADHKNVRATPAPKRQIYTHKTGACRHETTARPRDATAITACMAMMTLLRSRVSATCPAGSVISTWGRYVIKPTRPRASDEPVRS